MPHSGFVPGTTSDEVSALWYVLRCLCRERKLPRWRRATSWQKLTQCPLVMCRLRDNAFAAIARLPRLAHLSMRKCCGGCEVGSSPFAALLPLAPALTHLDVRGLWGLCWAVPEESAMACIGRLSSLVVLRATDLEQSTPTSGARI